jgi:hypothetical protein
MRIVILALVLTSATLAGTTVYYARQLSLERARNTSLPAVPSMATAPVPARVHAAPAPDARGAATPVTAAPADASAAALPQPMSEAQIKAMQASHARHFLAQIEDPQARVDLIAERKLSMRHSYPMLDRVLGLSPDEYARLLELFALQQMEMQEQHSRCIVEPTCELQALRLDDRDHQQQLSELLGADRLQRFETYKNSLGEREAVTQMRSRLPDSQRLSDESAEGLIAALAEERAALSRELAQRGEGTNTFSIGAGMLVTSTEGSLDTQLAAAEHYSQRLRDRAAQYLNPEQLRLFNEMQDEQLLSLRSLLRNKNGTFSAVAVPMN